MRYHPLRKKKLNKILGTVCNEYRNLCHLIEGARVGYKAEVNETELIAIEDIPAFFNYKRKLIPTLILVKLAGFKSMKYAVVDEGAVKHLLNGADVMAPGIIEVSEFAPNDIISVWKPQKDAPLVVGIALMSSEDIMKVRRGRAIKNIHYAGDKLWTASLQLYKALRK
jgi:PUA domain protein